MGGPLPDRPALLSLEQCGIVPLTWVIRTNCQSAEGLSVGKSDLSSRYPAWCCLPSLEGRAERDSGGGRVLAVSEASANIDVFGSVNAQPNAKRVR